jgi:hypothetical protein
MTEPVISDEVVEAALRAWFNDDGWTDDERNGFKSDMRSAITAAILSDREHTRAEEREACAKVENARIAELEGALRNYSCDCDDTFPDGIQECNGDHDVAWCGYRANQALRSRRSHTDMGGE